MYEEAVAEAIRACGFPSRSIQVEWTPGSKPRSKEHKSLDLTAPTLGFSYTGLPDQVQGYLAGLRQGCRAMSERRRHQLTFFGGLPP